jgi:tetratricopeptide (TPR) repeat protein
VQDELARAIAATLTQKVVGTSSGPLVQPATGNLDAYALYLRGRHAWALASLEGFQAAVGWFEQAVAVDSNYALAHAWLAYGYAMLGFDEFALDPPLDMMPKARAAANRAIELDDSLGDAHFARALVATLYDWDWSLAQGEFELAMESVSASSLAQHWYALFLCGMGRPDQALQIILRAQILDPLSLTVQVSVGRCLHYARRFDEAIERFRSHLELNPDSLQGYTCIARSLLVQRRLQEVVSQVDQGISIIGRLPILLSYSAQAHAWLGHTDRALALLAEVRQQAAERHVPLMYQAQIYFSLGDLNEGFRLLELAAEQRSGWMPFLRGEPGWDPLHKDPRFVALLRRLHLDF